MHVRLRKDQINSIFIKLDGSKIKKSVKITNWSRRSLASAVKMLYYELALVSLTISHLHYYLV